MSHTFLEKIYGVENAETQRDVYDQWADSYDKELTEGKYKTPARVAAALKSTLTEGDLATPVLDFGCGTGLSGLALADAGFQHIHGADVSTGMLQQAEAKKVYDRLLPLPMGNPDPGLVSRYRLVTAVGAISPGAAPASCLPAILMALPSHGRLAFSYNNLALEDAEYMKWFDRTVNSSEAIVEVDETGPHVAGLGSTARVLVIRRR
ncbi:class I SAM-dependent DNA methyltransferase [Pseudodonghicola xiamenensis]|uniref:SAM-dependent methyltransferase n=1 Tax=Pseudodonghicola xiamenensis TaxID=337702 RepID=A0A8J3MAP9_9RHOB|nr:methyltransferase domain-containing protein [Pseudodonghicola xiamenensis]GHG80733.1 SAM-dependent methyltransferase [Pseudodonghicola xiamenensis]